MAPKRKAVVSRTATPTPSAQSQAGQGGGAGGVMRRESLWTFVSQVELKNFATHFVVGRRVGRCDGGRRRGHVQVQVQVASGRELGQEEKSQANPAAGKV